MERVCFRRTFGRNFKKTMKSYIVDEEIDAAIITGTCKISTESVNATQKAGELYRFHLAANYYKNLSRLAIAV